jgi:nucleoside-diphosphate-sugar epimerase
LPLPEDDPRRRWPQIDKAKKLLGWEPRVDLAEGLKKTLSFFKTL